VAVLAVRVAIATDRHVRITEITEAAGFIFGGLFFSNSLTSWPGVPGDPKLNGWCSYVALDGRLEGGHGVVGSSVRGFVPLSGLRAAIAADRFRELKEKGHPRGWPFFIPQFLAAQYQ